VPKPTARPKVTYAVRADASEEEQLNSLAAMQRMRLPATAAPLMRERVKMLAPGHILHDASSLNLARASLKVSGRGATDRVTR
jgi:hypothetical protein